MIHWNKKRPRLGTDLGRDVKIKEEALQINDEKIILISNSYL
jgi:hypothetical protein